MLTELRASFRPAIVLLLLLAAVTGLAYPAAITGIAQALLPHQANGSLIVDKDPNGAHITGSELIAQGFASPRYFHPRPSAAGKGYEANNSSASNLAPGDKGLRDAVASRVADLRKAGAAGPIPADLVTSSASGLDPDISPEAALVQVPGIAKVRGISEKQLQGLIAANTDFPLLGLIGDRHVNVLLLNRQLDATPVKH
jgi:K+-transporting ATPase ATPase C chain